MQLFFYERPEAYAGEDFTVCGLNALLQADTTMGAQGVWSSNLPLSEVSFHYNGAEISTLGSDSVSVANYSNNMQGQNTNWISTGPNSGYWITEEADTWEFYWNEDSGWEVNYFECADIDTVRIAFLPTMPVDISFSPSICGSSNGAAMLVPIGLIPPLNVLWSNGDTSLTPSSLSSGSYTVIVTDSIGCVSSGFITVNDSDGPVINVDSIIQIDCSDSENGAIEISIAGGEAPYNFIWSNGAISEDLFGVSAGTYEVIVTDANNCLSSKMFSIIEPDPIDIVPFSENASCGGADGIAGIHVEGGVIPYTYFWSDFSVNQFLSGIQAGSYMVTVTDYNSCSAFSTVSVSENGGPEINFDSIINVTCNNQDGAIYITLVGGQLPYTVHWSDGSSIEDVSGLAPGFYDVSVTGSNSCVSVTGFSVLDALPSITPLGYVTVDASTNHVMVFWENIDNSQFSYYNLYRMSLVDHEYYLLASIPTDTLVVFEDTLSFSELSSWSYKLSTVNLCGIESFQSVEHNTIHLNVLQIGVHIKLVWNHYAGFDYSRYYIFRNINGEGYELIDSVTNSENSYIDTCTISGSREYFIEVMDDGSPLKSIKGYQQYYSQSNPKQIIFAADAIGKNLQDEQSFLVFPNPNNGSFFVRVPGYYDKESVIEVYDLQGRTVYAEKIKSSQMTSNVMICLKDLNKGVYLVMLRQENGYDSRLVFVE